MGQNNVLKLNTRYEKYLLSIAEGNIDSLKHLYDEIHSQVYFFALSILENEEDAKDVMQDTFVRIKFGAGRYKAGTNPKAWIFQIARNLSIDVIRKRKSGVDAFEEVELPDNRCFEDDVISNDFIFHLLSILNEEEKEIVTLHIYGELTHLDIAKVLSIPYPKVRWKYAYALKKLRNTLAEFDATGGVVHEKS